MTSIQDIRDEYERFKNDTEEKIKKFKYTEQYRRIISDPEMEKWLDSPWVSKNFQEIRKIYGIVNFSKDLYNHKFINMIREFSESKGFQPKGLPFSEYPTIIWAISHIGTPSISPQSIRHDLMALDFSRKEEQTGFKLLAYVPLFKVNVDNELNVDISLIDWKVIESTLSYLDTR